MKAFGWQLAEVLAATHMQSIGFSDSETTGSGTDKGLDVIADSAVAQVKAHNTPVGAPDVQRLRGASHGKKEALFYSLSGYTLQALEFAENSGVSLFTFDSSNNVEPANSRALRLIVESETSAGEQQVRSVLENHLKLLKQWIKLLDYFLEWLIVSPWHLHMPADLGDKLAQATDEMSESVKWPQRLTTQSASTFLALAEDQKEAISRGVQTLGDVIGTDLVGLSPSQCKLRLESILEGDISSLTLPNHLIPLIEKFSSREEGWRTLAECNRVVIRFKKFLKVTNANNKQIDVPSLEDDPRTRDAWLEVKEIVQKFGAWGNRAFDKGSETSEEGERLIREFSFAYARVIEVFGQDIEKLWKKSQKVPAKSLYE